MKTQEDAIKFLRNEGVDLNYDVRSGKWNFCRTHELLKALQKLDVPSVETLQGLVDIVDGAKSEPWSADGNRLKDTMEWTRFYNEATE